MRHGAFTNTCAAPALWPCLTRDARHAASTRSPSLRAIPSPPLPRTRASPERAALLYNVPLSHLAPAACVRRRFNETVDFLPLERRAPGPSPNPGPLALPLPTACLPDCGPLEPASAVAPAPFTAACAALTPFRLLARAGSFCARRGAEDDPGAPSLPPQGPPHRPAPALPAPHTLSTPLPSLTSPSPSTSTTTTPSILLSPRLS